jgi:hypothetical protein
MILRALLIAPLSAPPKLGKKKQDATGLPAPFAGINAID